MCIDFRKGDIVEFQIAGSDAFGFSGSGMVLDDNVVEKHLLDVDRLTGLVIIKDFAWAELRQFGRTHVTKIVTRREDIVNFWEYL